MGEVVVRQRCAGLRSRSMQKMKMKKIDLNAWSAFSRGRYKDYPKDQKVVRRRKEFLVAAVYLEETVKTVLKKQVDLKTTALKMRRSETAVCVARLKCRVIHEL